MKGIQKPGPMSPMELKIYVSMLVRIYRALGIRGMGDFRIFLATIKK